MKNIYKKNTIISTNNESKNKWNEVEKKTKKLEEKLIIEKKIKERIK